MTVSTRPTFSMSRALMLLMSVFFLASCTDPGPQNVNVVPSDASAVATFDFYSIAKKGKLDEFKEFKTYPKISEFLNEESEVLGDLFSQMIDDPSISGIDWSKKAIWFMEGIESPSAYMVLEMDDKAKFRAMLDKVKEEAAADAEDIKSGEGFDYIDGGGSIMAWNDNVVLMKMDGAYDSEAALSDVAERLANTQENSIAASEKFNTFYNEGNDVAFWMPVAQFYDIYSNAMNNMSSEAMPRMDWLFEGESFVIAALNFNKDDYRMTMRLDPSDEVRAKLDEIYTGEPLDADILNYLPADAYMLITAHSAKDAKSTVMELYGEDAFTGMDEVMANAGVPFKYSEILESFGGNFAMSISSIAMEPYMREQYNYYTGETEMVEDMRPNMGMSAVIDLTNRDVLDFAMDTLMVMSEGMLVQDGQQYYFEIPDMGTTVRVTYNEERAFITTIDDAMIAYLNGGYGDASLGKTDLGKKAASMSFYMYFNADMSTYPGQIQQMMNNPMTAQAKPVLDMLKSIELHPTGDYEGSYIINFHETEDNALYDLLSLMDDMGARFL